MAKRKTWQEKLAGGKQPHVEVLQKPFGGALPGARMLVSQPAEVDAYIRTLPPGTKATVADLRDALARQHGADLACPLSTSIFVRIAAEAALEDLALGKSESEITPFWRVVDPKSPLAKKLSCGAGFVEERRASESKRVSCKNSKTPSLHPNPTTPPSPRA
ncbi:MAG: hypothetical protein K2W91_13660 [Novosphingobium sp.]|nr:hypothetical protein [Novosphingobium sp.]